MTIHDLRAPIAGGHRRSGRMGRFWVSVAAALALVACEAVTERAGAGPPAARFEPTEAQRADILQAVQTVFDALGGRPELLEGVMSPQVVMHSIEVRADGTVLQASSSLDELEARIASGTAVMTERMWDPEVRVSGAVATVWTPYDFYVGDTFSHCGIDAVTLMRSEVGWRIVSLDWIRQQPPACALHPDGPPRG